MVTSRPAFFLLLGSLVLGCADSNAPAGPVDPPDELGEFAVGHSTFTLDDTARDDRSLLVDAWYPVDEDQTSGAMPRRYVLSGLPGPVSDVALADAPVSARRAHALLVFSHGYRGINTQSIPLMEILASHGFVVVSPEHTGNAQQSPTDSFDEAAANRVPDVSFLIDEMLRRNQDPSDPFHQRIERSRVGVLGHSFGGMTALGVAAGWAGAPPDPRVAAIVPISAVVVPELQSDTRTSPNAGFTQEQLESIRLPVMLLGGTEDTDVFIENNEVAFEQLVNAPRVYRVDVIGATHTHFANVCTIGDYLIERGFAQDVWPDLGAEDLLEPYELTCGPESFPIEEARRLTNLYSVAFFKRHLLGQTGYDAYLSADFADTEPAINLVSK